MATAVARVSVDATGAKKGASEYRQELDRLKAATRELSAAQKAGKVSKDEYKEAMARLRTATKETEAAFKSSVREADSLGKRYRRLASDLDPSIKATQEYRSAQGTLDAALKAGLITQAQHASQLQLAQARYRSATAGVSGLTAAFGGLRAMLASLGAVLAAVGIASVISSAISLAADLGRQISQTGSEYQQLRARLVTVTGGIGEANAAFADLKEFAASTPFEVDKLTQAFTGLMGAGIEPTNRVLTAFGNIAAAKGKDITEFADAVRGALTGETERLKAFDIIARVSGEKLTFVYQGVETQVDRTAGAITDHLVKMGETQFAGGMERQAATAAGGFSNLEDAAASLYDTIAQRSDLLVIQEQLYRSLAEAIGASEEKIGDFSEALSGEFLYAAEAFAVAGATIVDVISVIRIAAGDEGGPPIGARLMQFLEQVPVVGAMVRDLGLAAVAFGNVQESVDQLPANVAVRNWFEELRAAIAKARAEAAEFAERPPPPPPPPGVEEWTDAQQKLVESLRDSAAAEEFLASAAARGREEFEKAKNVVEVWTAQQKAGAGASKELLAVIKENILATQESKREQAGSLLLDDLEQRISAEEAILEAQMRGAQAAEEMRRHQALLADATSKTAGAAESMKGEIELALARLAELEERQRFESIVEQVEEETSAIRRSLEVRRAGAEAAEVMAGALEVEAEVRRETARLTGEEAQQIAAATRERIRMAAELSALARVQAEEAETVEALGTLRREDFLLEGDYLAAIARGNAEREVRIALIALEADRLRALAAVKREDFQTEKEYLREQQRINQEFADLAARQSGAIRARGEQEAADATRATWEDAAHSVGEAWVSEMAYAFQQIAINGADESEALANAMIGIFTAAGAAIGGALAGPMGAAAGGAIGGYIGASIFGPSLNYGGTSTIARESGDLAIIGENFGKTKDVMKAALLDLEAALGGFVTSLGEISIQVHEDGQGVRLMVGREWAGVFESVSEALTVGLRMALDEAEFSRTVSEFMQAILRGTRAATLEELQADIDFGRMVESFGLSDLEQEIRGIGFEFDRIFDELATLLERNVEQLTAGLGSVIGEEASRWESIYRELMGIEPTPEELRAQVERSARLYEAEKALRIVDLKARAIELQAQKETVLRRARLDELGLRTEAKLEAGRNHIRLAALEAGFRDLGFRARLYEAEQGLAAQHFGAMGEIVNAAALALEAQLAAIAELIAALEAIPPIDFGKLHIPKLGGGGGAQDEIAGDREQLQRLLEDFDLSQLGDYDRALAEINRKWADAAELAHGNAKLLEWVAEARRKEIEALERERDIILGQRHVDVLTRVENFGPQDELEQRLGALSAERIAIETELLALMEAGILTADDLARARERLQAGEEAHRAAMEREVRSEADDLMVRLLDAAGHTAEAAELRWQLEIAGYKLAIAEIAAKAELLGITVAQLDRMRELLGEIEGLGPPQVGGGTGSVGGVTDLQRERERALETLQGFLDLDLTPYERDLKRLTETFDELRATLGNTAEVQRAWMLALEDLNDRYTSQIRDYLDTLRDPLLNPVESVAALEERFRALAATGDLSQSGELMQLAEQLQAAYLAAYGSASAEGGGFSGLLDMIESVIQGFLGESGGAGSAVALGNVLPFPTLAAQAEVGVVQRVGESNQILGRIEDLMVAVERNTAGAPREMAAVRDAVRRAGEREIEELRAGRFSAEIGNRRLHDSLLAHRGVKLGRVA